MTRACEAHVWQHLPPFQEAECDQGGSTKEGGKSPHAIVRCNSKRRGVFLVEMLTVIVIVGIGGGLMAVGLSSVLRGQRRVAEFSDQFAEINDFLRCFARDARISTSAQLLESEHQDARQVVTMDHPGGPIIYRIYPQKVTRNGTMGISAKEWRPMIASAAIVSDPASTNAQAVRVSVSWFRGKPKDPEPSRRFDLVARCSGELANEPE